MNFYEFHIIAGIQVISVHLSNVVEEAKKGMANQNLSYFKSPQITANPKRQHTL